MIRFSCIESLHTVNLNDFTVYSKSDGKMGGGFLYKNRTNDIVI
jgi:hypothetical protein